MFLHTDKNLVKKFTCALHYSQVVKIKSHPAVSYIIGCLWAHCIARVLARVALCCVFPSVHVTENFC
jgi:hypothetical protein